MCPTQEQVLLLPARRLQAHYQASLLQQRFLTEAAAAVAAIAAATAAVAAVDDDNYTAKTTKAVDQ